MAQGSSAQARACYNNGVLEARRGASDAALAAFAQAAALDAAWAEPLYASGHVRFLRGDLDGAAAAFEGAIARAPDHLAAHVDLAQTRIRQQRYSQAAELLARARMLAPADETIWWKLRGVLLALGRGEDALADFRAFEAHAPPSSRVRVAALASARRLGDAAYEAQALPAVLDHPFAVGEADLVAETLGLVQYFDVAPAALCALYDRYDALVRAEIAGRGERAPDVAPAPDARIGIGYLSADFRGHVMGRLLAPVLAAHDRTRYRIVPCSLAPPGHDDAFTARFRAASDGWLDLARMDDAAAAAAIAAQGLDVLVDLMGHSAFARPAILARKPARRIVTHLGYHGGVGLASVDAKITDRVADLPDGAGALREPLLPLDVCVLPLHAYAAPAVRYERAALGLADDAVVIAAFVPAYKLSPRCVALWTRVLDRVPQACLLLSPPRADDRAALVRQLTGLGIEAARLAFVPYEVAHLADRYALADLALDTLPYTGGDTTAAALAAGVPVVTLVGARHAERMTASILVHAGLPELVASDADAFVDLACRLASDRALAAAMRLRVEECLSRPALSDPARYAAALERAYDRVLAAPPRPLH
jgi:predicted O-linked N-acetylglucosamine transferase (SPINDLY family)